MGANGAMADPSISYAPFPSTIRFYPSETSGFYLPGGLRVGVSFDGGDANFKQLGLSITTH